MKIYLDNASTTELSPEMKKYIIKNLDYYGNPSSHHKIGQKSWMDINWVRALVGEFINANETDIYFTSGGSASNTLAIKGYYTLNECTIFYSPALHKSAMLCINKYNNKIPLKIDSLGQIDIKDFANKINQSKKPPFVVLEYANSETGMIESQLKELIKITHEKNGVVYVDATGSISQIPLNTKQFDIDMCGFSAHKIGALKGCGVLYKKPDIILEPIIYGSQENGLIGGTENILGIKTLGYAINQLDYSKISFENRDYVYQKLKINIDSCYLIGDIKHRLPHNLYMCFKGIDGEQLALLLNENNIFVSTGSACNSGNKIPSSVLIAMGINDEDLHSCIRMTFNGKETKDELDYVYNQINYNVFTLRLLSDTREELI